MCTLRYIRPFRREGHERAQNSSVMLRLVAVVIYHSHRVSFLVPLWFEIIATEELVFEVELNRKVGELPVSEQFCHEYSP